MTVYKYITADSRNIEKVFKKHKIEKPDLIITSPPYFDVKNYEEAKKQIGFGQDYSEYLKDTITIFQKCYELSSPNATFWMISDTIKKDGITIPLPFDLHRELTVSFSSTWKLKDLIIWNKTKNIPWNAKGRFKNHFEYIFFYVKTGKYKFNIDKIREVANLKKWWLTYPERYNPRGKPPSNIWEFITPIRGWGNGYLNHVCPFPFPLVERIISISTDEKDLIFDPFAGSGSTIAMAYAMNRNSVGIDINKKYKERFEEEVLIGAHRYWIKREEELKSIDEKIKEFKLNNIELRKNKLGSIAIQWIKQNFVTSNPIFLIVENEKNQKEIDCIVVGKEKNINVLSFNNEKEINKLIRTFKIKINWKITNQNDLLKTLSNITLYKYNYNKTYKYISSLNIKELMNEPHSSDCFFSNIDINISKADDVFI